MHDIEELRSFPFLDSDNTMDVLKSELPYYMAAAKDVQWWKSQEH